MLITLYAVIALACESPPLHFLVKCTDFALQSGYREITLDETRHVIFAPRTELCKKSLNTANRNILMQSLGCSQVYIPKLPLEFVLYQ